ncbi:PREDICTED: protein unc-80 homolog isoform X2 [Papilio xuthus]|uniref:Protein unc-80 homolog isoform X2 n=1 Tax=Papilio xuthus TaxID=66420 RepID=A0AAJ6ZJX6_PAPXU|nr:PREDICTED: protein unc-80 homolog isoform X2 [Papilio xuthus]
MKELLDEDSSNEEVVPIPVQIFLWRQTTPFVRPRLGKVHDASCMFCQRAPGHHELKEACKSFEKVLVQNLRFGLSVSLTDAIESIPRWRLIQAALPHVMHALAALLHTRIKDNMQSLGNVETKLLYTLHWILLDASDECADNDYENDKFYSNPFYYLFSIPTITLFVFLFAPISQHLKESDFTNNYRLENGLKMWQALWEFRHPDAACFTTLVKPKPRSYGGKYSKRSQPEDVFLGRKFSKEEGGNSGSPPSQNVSVSQSDIPSKQASTEEEPWVSSPKDTIFPETIPEESSSTEEEHVFIYRLPSEQNYSGPYKEVYTVYAADPSLFQVRKPDNMKPTLPGIKPLPQITKMSSSDKESLSDSGGGCPPMKGTPTSAEKAPSVKQGNVSAATFLDVATLRCLFTTQWQEEGVYWALYYLYNRLRDICDDMSKQIPPRKRSNSLPVPKIEVSVYQSPDIKEHDSLKNFMEVPESKEISPITEIPFASVPKVDEDNIMTRRASEKVKRKMKMADLKAFVETKLLSKSEKALEKIGQEEHKFSFHTAEYHRSLDTADDRPNSALATNFQAITPRLTGDLLPCNLIKGKSMPSLSCLIDELASNGYIGEARTERTHGQTTATHSNILKKKNPIITVTEHTPTPSPDYLSKTRQGSMESQLDSISMQGSQHMPTPERKPSLTRSQTDSNITYIVEEIQEAAGSKYYITKDGDIDLQIILKAVYSVSTMDSYYITVRVMEVMLNLVDTLMEIGVHKNWQTDSTKDVQPETIDPLSEFVKDKDSKERDSGIPCAPSQESTNVDGGESKEKIKEEENLDCPYYMIMHIILRLLRQLGCSHGCTSALRGPQAECLRVQARNSLRQLRSANVSKFNLRIREMTKFAPLREVLDNLHATIGFCAEPSNMVSPMNQQKRNFAKSPDISHLQVGYATNFGTGQNANTHRAIENFVIEATFRVLVTRFALMHKELKMLDNSALYMEVRLLLSYVKEAHGSEFRLVALSALLDTAERPDSQQRENNMQTTRVIRHIPRMQDDERGSDTGADSGCGADDRSHKKFTFKKRSTSSTGAHSLLETEAGDESASQSPLSVRTRRYQLTPRQSERTIPSAASADITPHHMTHKSLHSRFHIGGIVKWFKTRPQPAPLARNGGGSGESLPQFGSMVSLARPHLTARPVHVKRRVGYTLNRARKRVEDRLNRFGLRKMGKKRDGSIEESSGGYMSRRGSLEGGSGGGESEVVVLKRRRLVCAAPLYAGLARLNFLLDATQPGATPDALFIAALLDLPFTVVVARASVLLECAHLVHNCNKGQWPHWLKSNMVKNSLSASPQLRRRLAGKLFYQWAEAIGNRLEEMLNEDKKHLDTVVSLVTDPDGQRELLQQDEEEDFLDEASIRLPGKTIGAECPRALRLVACVLLFEITAFLRETYQNLPKSSRSSLKERGPWDRVYREANRRWSMALSSMGHSQASAQSLQSIAGVETERKISFVLHEPENVSGGSNVTLADAIPSSALEDKKGRLGSRGKAPMHRRNTQQTHSAYGSFKRRSIKLRQKDTREVDEFITRRSDSIQSRRKVSSLSDRSDTSEVFPGTGTVIMANEMDSGGEESPGVLSDDHDPPPDSPDSNSTDPPDNNKGFPWLKVMVKFLNSFNYVCCHQNFCHPYCFRRNMRATVRLMKSVQKIYGEKFGPETSAQSSEEGSGGARRGRRTRKPSEHVTDRIDRSVIETAGLAYRAAGVEHTLAGSEAPPAAAPGTLPYPPPDPPNILKYLKGQVREAYHMPLATLVKGATTMSEEMFSEVAPVAWRLLLEADRELSSCAAALFILVAVRAPHVATDIMHNDLKHADPGVRINAILRFQVIWKLRYQVWPRMEEGASVTFKVPPPGIEFTLPSPKIGIESLAVVDPPWSPQVKDKDMEMTLNQERHRSLVTATKTRKKQQTEAIKRALQQRNDKKKAERESFLITTIPITRQAAREPALDHVADDHVEPPADEEVVEGVRGSHHAQVAAPLFPSALCSAVAEIVSLLDDAAVSRDGCSVYEVAYQCIWGCLVEDSALFLRHVLERLTRDHQDEMFKLLRHLIRFIPRLPQQAAFALYNYIIGYVMFYVRTPHEGGQRLIGAALSILWMVVHSVHGIMFKDLKQILRKEQCDASILLTANVPAAKKIIVHGPSDNEGSIPSQFPVQEDTQFCQILRESLDFFSIPDKLHDEYFLVDFKTRQIHNPQSYVRDHYFFKRSQYPQLGLVHMEPEEAFHKLQQQELLQKFVEIGKVLLTWAILKNVDMVVQRVVFLHDELMKLPSFPRKALEADLDLYSRGKLGSTLLGLDVLHKFMWVRLIARMFEAMAGNFTSSRDIHLFLNVLNGALMLHSEDSLILRYVIATYVNAAFNFKSIFSTNGYLLIMPTLLQIYSNFQTNKLVTTTIEYAVKQFYLLNRKPFILQMFGSVSAILDTDEEATYGDASKVQSSCLFNLLLSLETPSPDPLHIAELIKEEKPLKPIDFCYRDEDEMVNVLDCISLCVMVVSYSAESMRGYQMLIILEAILPCYVKQIQLPTYNREGKTEKEIIQQLAIAIKTLVNNCEGLSKSYNGPYRTSPEHKGSSQRGCARPAAFVPLDLLDDESHSRYVSEHARLPPADTEDSELVRAEYRRPRDVLLSLVGEFIGRASSRLLDLNGSKGSGGSEGKPVELLDSKSHARLAEIAHSLLKVSPYDPESMGCRGLQRYMTLVLPAGEWADMDLRPSLIMILRRLDKVFLKIAKKPSIRRNTDWDSAAVLLKGVYETMVRCPYIMHWQQVKTLLNTVQALIVSESTTGENLSSATAALMSQPPPPHFCSTVVRLIALQVINTGDSYSLEQMCGGTAIFPSGEKTENMLMNLLMPLCLRVGSGRKDVPPLRQSDVSYVVSAVLCALCPPAPPGQLAAVNAKLNAADARANSLTFTGSRDIRNTTRLSNQLYRIAFLALKVICACFTSELCCEWGRIARAMRELGRRNEAAHHLWDFLEHVVTYRTPLYVLLQPFIVHKLSQPPIGDHERHMQFVVRERARGLKLPAGRARGALLAELARELRTMRDTHDHYKFEQIAESLGAAGGKRASEAIPRGDKQQQHRPSLISMLVGRAGPPRTPDHPAATLSAQRESVSSSSTTSQQLPPYEYSCPGPGRHSDTSNNNGSLHSQIGVTAYFANEQKPPGAVSYAGTQTKLRFVSSVEFKLTSGETTMSPLSPLSTGEGEGEGEASCDEGEERPRLQRAHGPSKKTFKFRRSRHASKPDAYPYRVECEEWGGAGMEASPPRRPPLLLPPAAALADSSYDSEISQTSSTSGYRESYSLQASMSESPGGSVRAALASPEPRSQRTASASASATPHASPDASLSCDSSSAERTALLGAASQRSLLTSDLRDEDTLL